MHAGQCGHVHVPGQPQSSPCGGRVTAGTPGATVAGTGTSAPSRHAACALIRAYRYTPVLRVAAFGSPPVRHTGRRQQAGMTASIGQS